MKTICVIIGLLILPILSLAQTTNIRDRDGRLIGTKHYVPPVGKPSIGIETEGWNIPAIGMATIIRSGTGPAG